MEPSLEAPGIDAFVKWFQLNGGYIDMSAMGITEFPDSGRGAIALRDIPEGHTLFTVPRSITLSTRTSPLPALFGLDAWRARGLHKGWIGLILCMMWEDAWAHELDIVHGNGQGQVNVQTRWGPYMRTLPITFDTPMFWSAEELEELRGTAVINKIGRHDADHAYSEQLVPAINTSVTLFPPSHHGKWYTLEAYHRSGSRVLSRSFMVSRWTDDDNEVEEDEDHENEVEAGGSDADTDEDPRPNPIAESSVNIDNPRSSFPDDPIGEVDLNSEDDEDPSDVAMVPMADILNARWCSENAKLFYEPAELRMITTKTIKQGEQIFNTYGDLPNSDLLRRYGHVDLVQLSSSSVPMHDDDGDVKMKGDADTDIISHMGNPSDIVEIPADFVVRVIRTTKSGSKMKDVHARIEWWLDEGEDDIFVLSSPKSSSQKTAIPPSLISFTLLLVLSEPDFKSAFSKGKLPKGKLKRGTLKDAKDNKEVLEILDQIFSQREGMYVGGSIEDDEHLLSHSETLARRKRHAVIVRLGEKRILRDVRQVLRVMLAELSVLNGTGHGDEKRDTRTDKKGWNGGKEADSGKKRAITGTEGDRGWKKARK